jgi:putative ABC transport system substrate-binding protein
VKRREFITLLAGAAAWPLCVRAQQPGRVYRIGFLANDPTIPTTPPGQAFLDGLRESGFVEGQNITIERRFARGRVGLGAELAAELVRLGLDLVVASGDQNVIATSRLRPGVNSSSRHASSAHRQGHLITRACNRLRTSSACATPF